MSQPTRRSFIKDSIKTGLGAATLTRIAAPAAQAQSPTSVATQPSFAAADFGLSVIGKVAPRPSLSIKASHLSLGFETLDRRMFAPEKTYGYVAQLGVKWARTQTGWARTETKKSEYDFAWLDGVTDSLLKIGVQPWFSLSYGNRLYTPEAPNEYAVGWVPLNNAEAKQGWVNYAGKIAERFRTRVRHWEIWNESDAAIFWRPGKPNPEHYVELVKLATLEIRKRAPGAVIVGGALAYVPRSLDFLEGCLELGLAQYVDRISYHPYRQAPEANYEAEIRAFRALVKRYKPSLDIWQGENGAPSSNNGCCALAGYDWNETRQAKWLLRRLLTDLKLDIELTSYLHIVDMHNYILENGLIAKVNYKGLLRGKDDYTPKPSYFAYQNLCALFDAETKPADFVIRSVGREADDVYTASFVRQGAPVFARWLPVSLQRDTPVQPSAVELWSGKAARMTEPVLIDLLTGQVYKPEKAQFSGGWWKIENLPLTDYPLVITDAALLKSNATEK